MNRDLYQVLQVDPAADAEVLEAAYHRLARKYHPDVSPAPDAEARMRELNEAYGVLRDPAQRAAYDRRRTQPAVIRVPRAPRAGRRQASPSAGAAAAPSAPRVGAESAPTAAPRARAVAEPDPAEPAPRASRATRRRGARWERIADGLVANRYVIVGGASALLLTALIAALAARLFVPGELAGGVADAGRGVVVVTRAPTGPEATATAVPRAGTPTASRWPPFIYVFVPAPSTPTPEEGPPPAPRASPGNAGG